MQAIGVVFIDDRIRSASSAPVNGSTRTSGVSTPCSTGRLFLRAADDRRHRCVPVSQVRHGPRPGRRLPGARRDAAPTSRSRPARTSRRGSSGSHSSRRRDYPDRHAQVDRDHTRRRRGALGHRRALPPAARALDERCDDRVRRASRAGRDHAAAPGARAPGRFARRLASRARGGRDRAGAVGGRDSSSRRPSSTATR